MNIIKQIRNKLDKHTFEVIQRSSGSLIIKVIGIVASLGVSILLGRTIGAEGLGIIDLANRIIDVVLVFSLLGMRQVVIKEVAIAYTNGDEKHIGNVMYSSIIINGGFTLFISILLILATPFISRDFFNETRLVYPLIIFLSVAFPQILSRLYSSALVGFNKIWQSNLVERTLSAAMTGILLLGLILFEVKITIISAAASYAFGRIFVAFFSRIYWKKLFRNKQKKKWIGPKLLKSSIPLLFVSTSLIISSSIDSVMLGWLTESRDVGLYNVAIRIALMTSFFIQITNSAIMPKIASLFHTGKKDEMIEMVNNTTKILALIGLFFLFLFILFGKFILSFWGEEFIDAYHVLIIVSVGQFFNIATGPVGSLLVMCNYEKILQNITIATLIINVLLNYIMINFYGIEGAAISTSVTMILNMLLCLYFVKRKLNFWTLKI